MARIFTTLSSKLAVLVLLAASTIGSGSTAPVATLNFDVLSGAGDEVSKLGQDYISLDVFDHEVGVVGFRVRNMARELSMSIEQVNLSDGASMLLRNGYEVEKDAGQQVHFIVDKEKRALSEEGGKLKKTASGDEEPSVWDLSLVRRKEVSRAGRMLHSNAINGQEALTLLVRPVSEVFDADLLADALSSCVLRVGVRMRAQDGQERMLINRCDREM